jgi:2-dehydropantoate 2-reductase
MRFVIYGAGAIGGTIGAQLHRAGRDVVLIARGRHLERLQSDGLRFQTPDGEERLAIPAVGSPVEAEVGAGDIVILAVKTQDSAGALEQLAALGAGELVLVCAQNGVENERLALRRFADVYGMLVYLPAQHIEAGVVQCFATPNRGILDLGRAPSGLDERAASIAASLSEAGFASQPRGDIMRWKYAKLLTNLGNAAQALFGPASAGEWSARARAEALECYRAADIDCASEAEVAERRKSGASNPRPVGGNAHAGGSSWQSLARGSGTIEADYLNGEIVLLGRLYGVATPVNAALAQVATRMARNGEPAGSADPASVEQAVQRVSSPR